MKRLTHKLFLVPIQWIIFQFNTLRLKVNHEYIRHMYANLVQLDWIDFVDIGPYQVQAFGLTAIVRRDGYEFTISENMQNKQIYVHERINAHQFSPLSRFNSSWHEIYRTNRLLSSTRFVLELYRLEKEIEKVADSLPDSGGTTI